jgi:SAM-dependent methyltransferase
VKPVEYRRMFEAEERQWWYAGQRAVALALFEPWARDKRRLLLDAGCGTGFNLVALARFGPTLGIDLSERAIAFCRERGVRAVRGSVLRLPFRADAFEAVTSFDVIYHDWVGDDGAAVTEMARVLRPGGALLVRVPALELLRGAHDAEVLTRRRYTLGELRALVEGCGLRVERATYCNSLLFPVLFARRTLDRLLGRHGSDVGFLPPLLERLFRRLMEIEAFCVRHGLRFPIGASAVVLAIKPSTSGG